MDPSEVFARYEALLAEVDKVFERVKELHPERVTCHVGCGDCCHALFDLPLIEAMHVNRQFNERFSGAARDAILQRADAADRQTYKIKKWAFQESQKGRDTNEILAEVAARKVRCPLLGDDTTCALYEFRPVTCRLYGVPMNIGGQGRTCGMSGFKPGVPYPAVQVEKIQDRLMSLSKDLAKALGSRHTFLPEVLVPVSMALMNAYDEDYLGTGSTEAKSEPKSKVRFTQEGKTMSWAMGDEAEEPTEGAADASGKAETSGCACVTAGKTPCGETEDKGPADLNELAGFGAPGGGCGCKS